MIALLQRLFPPLTTDLREALTPLFVVFAFALGAASGSFLNVVIWRLPRGECLSRPPSHCPRCQARIRAWQNLPLLSWIMLRGRCFNCHLPISLRYPLIELIGALLFSALWWWSTAPTQVWLAFFPHALFLSLLLACAMTDWDHGIIPDRLTRLGILAALLCAAAWPRLQPVPEALLAGGAPGESLITAALLNQFPLLQKTGPHGIAALHCLLGVLAGAALLGGFRLAANLLLGSVRPDADPGALPGEFSLTPAGLGPRPPDPAAPPVPLDRLLPADADYVRLDLRQARLLRPDGPATGERLPRRLLLFREGVETSSGQFLPWNDTWEVTGTLRGFSARRDTVGLGDVKLLAMIGAFLGPDACIYVLLLAALPAALAGLLILAVPPLRRAADSASLRFGPWLALAATSLFFFGNHLVLWFRNVILSLLLR